MKLPNGFGSIYKLSGKRRRPWVAAKTFGWQFDEEGQRIKQKRQVIGYFATRQEAMTALVQYNENPYDLDSNKITFSEVYEKWSDKYFPTLGNPSSIRTETVVPYFNGFSRFLLATSMLRIHFCIILYSFNHVILYKKKSPHSSAGSCMIVRTFSYLRDIFNVPDSFPSVTHYRAR